MTTPATDAAVAAWRAALGDGAVVTEPEALHRASATTHPTPVVASCVLRPVDVEGVRAALRVAAAHRVAVYPFSGGTNWGLGGRAPLTRPSALLDLGGMRRIHHLDEDLAYVDLEPGVTFRQLHEELASRGSRLFASTTGGSPRGSVVANALERGDGSGPLGDRAQHVGSIQVVLSTGEVVHTGFGRFAGTPLSPLSRVGVGPSLDGLFVQSPWGVVTRMAVHLTPLPRALAVVRFQVQAREAVGLLAEAIRELRLEGTLRSVTGLWNDYRVLSAREPFPAHATAGRRPLRPATLEVLREAWGGGAWSGTLALFGATRAVTEALVARAVERLGPLSSRLSVDLKAGEPRSGQELFLEGDPAFRFLQGVPHESSLRSVYFHKGPAPGADLDPERDGCGVLWVSACLPLRAAEVREATALAERWCLEAGFEPLLALVAQTERTAYLVVLLVWDRAVPGDDARAVALHDRLGLGFVERGWLPHRLGALSLGHLPPCADDGDAVLSRIGAALDPAGVMAPGRYVPSSR